MAVLSLDHLIFAGPDLDEAVAAVARLTGVEPVAGGSHTGRGTRNALLSLGPDTYIEVLAPDPAQTDEERARASSRIPPSLRLHSWAAKCDDLDAAFERARDQGLDLGRVEPMSRALPSGEQLHWRLTRGELPGDGLVPFLIDWGSAAHPAPGAPGGCALISLRAEHPDPERIAAHLAALDLADSLPVTAGPAARLVATLTTPRGEVELS